MFRVMFFLLILSGTVMPQTKYRNINEEISQGNFTKAAEMIEDVLRKKKIMGSEKNSLLFEIERLIRIEKDFKLTETDVLDYVKKYIPDADAEMLRDWEKDGSLEYKIIEGEKRYFNRAPSNLFRVNKEAKSRKEFVTGKSKDDLDLLLEKIVPGIVADIDKNDGRFGTPEKMKLTYELTVPADKVPHGESVKCWLPYPREGIERQYIIDFSSNDDFVVADNSHLQRSVYFEKIAEKGKPTIFGYELVISTKAENYDIDPSMVKDYKQDSLYQYFTSERPPHIFFSDKVKELSQKIVEGETNPYLKARKIFTWISNNIPWAGAREYSTILNISDYCITNMRGDCGIKTLLFMTLARYNGIPAKWQSGWMLHPGEKNLHDWCEAYFEGYGWVPVDQSIGLIDSGDPRIKYFYLGGIDQYRFTVNDDYTQPFYPEKEFPRSETVDFQRGEVEWSGGNLYFDDWSYKMRIDYLE